MSNIVNEGVEQYLRGMLPPRTGLLQQIEEHALSARVPIVQPEVARLLFFLASRKKGGRILEIGTATGYSALWLALGTGELGQVTTIELAADRAALARDNFSLVEKEAWAHQFRDRPAGITLLEGDALQLMPTLEGFFDLIFVDAAKGQYPGFLSQAERLLSVGGLLVADNVLFRGLVALPDQEVDKRYRTLVGRLRTFLETVTTKECWDTTILPIGDGVSVSCKVEV